MAAVRHDREHRQLLANNELVTAELEERVVLFRLREERLALLEDLLFLVLLILRHKFLEDFVRLSVLHSRLRHVVL